ncbi:hypothetical protein MNBD_CPR01-92, partial [hydrothermal vent metagenome]
NRKNIFQNCMDKIRKRLIEEKETTGNSVEDCLLSMGIIDESEGEPLRKIQEQLILSKGQLVLVCENSKAPFRCFRDVHRVIRTKYFLGVISEDELLFQDDKFELPTDMLLEVSIGNPERNNSLFPVSSVLKSAKYNTKVDVVIGDTNIYVYRPKTISKIEWEINFSTALKALKIVKVLLH